MKNMTIKDLQRNVDNWVNQFSDGYWSPHEILARLIEEVGEVSREINHLYGPTKKKHTEETRILGDEIGDAIFTLVCLANSKNIDLTQAMEGVIKKYTIRDSKRYKNEKQ